MTRRIAVLALLAALGCGFREYHPRGWQTAEGSWVYANQDIRIRLRSSGLSDSSSTFYLEPEITNLSSGPLFLETVRLTSKGAAYEAVLPFNGDFRFRTLQPGSYNRIHLRFDLPRVALFSVGDQVEIKMGYHARDREPEYISAVLESAD